MSDPTTSQRGLVAAGFDPENQAQQSEIARRQQSSIPGLASDREPLGIPPEGLQHEVNFFGLKIPIGPRVMPRYFSGDELLPGNLGLEYRMQLQKDLEAAGLLDRGYVTGDWGPSSINAYASALSRANVRGVSVNEVISELKSLVNKYGKPTEQRKLAPGIITLTNPMQISDMANELSVRVLGRRLSSEESNRYANIYNQMEREFQQQEYQLRLQGAENTIAGELTAPPSAASFLQSQTDTLKATDPQASSQQTTLNAADIFFDMLKSSRL